MSLARAEAILDRLDTLLTDYGMGNLEGWKMDHLIGKIHQMVGDVARELADVERSSDPENGTDTASANPARD
jgi:hypothetical protein